MCRCWLSLEFVGGSWLILEVLIEMGMWWVWFVLMGIFICCLVEKVCWLIWDMVRCWLSFMFVGGRWLILEV